MGKATLCPAGLLCSESSLRGKICWFCAEGCLGYCTYRVRSPRVMSSVPVEPVCTFTPSFLNYDRPTALMVFRAHDFEVCSHDEFRASSTNLLIPAHAALTKSPRIKPSFGKITLPPTFSLMPAKLLHPEEPLCPWRASGHQATGATCPNHGPQRRKCCLFS